MKQRILQLALLLAVMLITRCSEDEKPKTVPEVTTAAVTDFTTTTATVGGEVTDDGNAEITVTGIVYSSVVGVPTTADDKIELTDTEGDFSTLLEDLNSGTLYHVRAFATNSKGTGYGDVVDFTTGNAAPVATNVSVTGAVEVNGTLTATYTYTDSEGDAQATSKFQWYVADNATGTGEVAIAGATSLTYIIQVAEQTKFVRFGVTPKAGAGNLTGTEVKSAFVGAVGEATTVTFMYNGVLVTYGILNSTATGKKWLDRNLGAGSAPSSFTDFANYGHLFQWGRPVDGHQLVTRTGPNDGDATGVNGTTETKFTTVTPPNPLFVINPNGDIPVDWLDPQNNNLWQGVSGVNNPCPAGWRIPTQAEFLAEGIVNVTDAFSKLKLTLTGVRRQDGSGILDNALGVYWTSTTNVSNPDHLQTYRFRVSAPGFSSISTTRASGNACRCIKD